MRKSVALMAAAASWAALIGTVAAAVAAPLTLSQCISGRDKCMTHCVYYPNLQGPDSPLPPSYASSPLEAQLCKNKCDANHAACVDRAFSSKARLQESGSSKKPHVRTDVVAAPEKPRVRTNVVVPPGSLLESSPSFSTQSPAATGKVKGGGAGTLY